MKTKLLFALLALSMSSCSSFMYSNKAVNNTIRLNSNVSNYSVSFPLLKNQYGNKKDVTEKNWTYTLPELKKKYTTIEVSSENYETQRFVIAKSVRPVPVIMDLTLSLFTFGLPLIIDPFKSDFYKVSEISKNINVEFVYKQSYMWSEYNKIKQSESSYVFEQFLSKYPRFENKAMVINTKDSVEFNTALAQNTEIAITDFIRTHSASLYTAKAVKIEEQFVKNRKDFEETKSINSVESYENFILNHPFAIQLNEAHKLLVDVAEEKATKSNNVISLIAYQNNYLNPNKKYFSQDVFNSKQFKIQTEIKAQLVKELKNKDYNTIKKFYDSYIKSYKNQISENDIVSYMKQIKLLLSEILFPKLLKFNNQEDQNSFVKLISEDFPGVYLTQNLVTEVLDNTQNKNGKLVIYNVNYIRNTFTQNETKGKYKNSISNRIIYKSNNYNYLESSDKEVLNFKNNLLDETQESYLSNEISYKLNITNGLINKEEFFNSNKLIEIIYYSTNGSLNFKYEFDNGTNITLQQLDKDIKDVDYLLSIKRVEDALEGYKNLINNKYPSDITQNKSLKIKLANCQKLKDEKDKREELARQKEQKRLDKIRQEEERRQARIRQAEEQRSRNSSGYSESSEDRYQSNNTIQIAGVYKCSNEDMIRLNSDGTGKMIMSYSFEGIRSFTWEYDSQSEKLSIVTEGNGYLMPALYMTLYLRMTSGRVAFEHPTSGPTFLYIKY